MLAELWRGRADGARRLAEIDSQAGQLQELMSFFKIDQQGSAAKAARPAARATAAPAMRNAGARPAARKVAAAPASEQDFERF